MELAGRVIRQLGDIARVTGDSRGAHRPAPGIDVEGLALDDLYQVLETVAGDDVLRTLVDRIDDNVGIQLFCHCDQCHVPAAFADQMLRLAQREVG